MRHHFHVPARELTLDQDPVPCPVLPALTFEGLAVTEQGQHHLILTLGGLDRFYLGPDDATVSRRTGLLGRALHDGIAGLDTEHVLLVQDWVQLVWESALDELVTAFVSGEDWEPGEGLGV